MMQITLINGTEMLDYKDTQADSSSQYNQIIKLHIKLSFVNRQHVSVCKKVLFWAATKSVHSTMLSGVLSVETAVCATNVVSSRSLVGSQQAKPSLQSVRLSQ